MVVFPTIANNRVNELFTKHRTLLEKTCLVERFSPLHHYILTRDIKRLSKLFDRTTFADFYIFKELLQNFSSWANFTEHSRIIYLNTFKTLQTGTH